MGEEEKKSLKPFLHLLGPSRGNQKSHGNGLPKPVLSNTNHNAIQQARLRGQGGNHEVGGHNAEQGFGLRGSSRQRGSQAQGQVPWRQNAARPGLLPNSALQSHSRGGRMRRDGPPYRRSSDQPRNNHFPFDGTPRTQPSADPLLDKLTKLLRESDSTIVLTLANPSFGFENIIKEKLQVPVFKIIMKLLDRVCHSEFDKNRATILTQACSSEFLDQFINLLMLGIQLPSNELANLLLDMLNFCDEVIKLLPMTACDKLPVPLNGCYSCAQNLASNGTIKLEQSILDKFKSLLEHIKKIASEFQDTKCNFARESKKEQMQILPPPDNFRELSIYPKADDIMNCKRPFLRPNIVKGCYNDVEHYLDVQFRLLREDYMRPLREGIADYVRGKSNRKCESLSVRIYTGVQFLRYVKEETKKPGQRVREGNLLSFDLSKLKRVDWEHSKRFMHGSLLCLSKNNFETLLFATVAEHDARDLKNGHLLVKFCETYEENIYDKKSTYIMVESEVYFEPYFQVLNTLKEFTEEDFPMPQYIIKMQNYDSPPAYLLPNIEEVTEDDGNKPKECTLYRGKKRYKITVLDSSTWPTAETLGLDPSQHRALQAALTRELVVIQGPPGTGKTFMALKIAEILIKNKTSLGRKTPILVVCLTNHALDQFLVEILKVTDKLIRIGGQSKCEALENYNLRKMKIVHSKQSASLFRQLTTKITDERNKLQIFEEKLETMRGCKGILSLQSLESVISLDVMINLKGRYLKWLSGVNMGGDKYYEAENRNTILIEHLKSQVFKENNEKRRGLQDAFENFQVDEFAYAYYREQLKNNLQFRINAIANLEYQLQNRDILNEKHIANLLARRDMWKLNVVQRWQLYNHWVNQLEKDWQDSAHQLENTLFVLRERLEELRFHDDLEVLRSSEVVGMTTNGAARLHKMLKHLKCEVVIVEEAAEVMESHVIGCLNEHCKHLILIGDHKQLRPSISVYELGLHFNFDVSLFERMVRNRGQCETLGVQHRMAPDMAKLIVPTIYPVLANDKEVLERPLIVGVPHRLFFINHNQPELQDTEMSSRKNEHEAQFLLALCRHLILQGYKPEQITILATYRGQMFHMKKELRKAEFASIVGVQITVVDNFQGEENDIILLSLVRSNEEGRIGFLATENRVCVALSRARQGLYIIGNMEILSAASKTWKAVNASLSEQQAVGPTLTLRCQVHPDQYCEVRTSEDFLKYSPEGGCTQICTYELNCSHTCDKICHSLNRDHSEIKCYKPCLRKCKANLHGCKKKCKDVCGDCLELVIKTLPCGHSHEMSCYQEPENFKCTELVEKEFKECEHKGTVQCWSTKCPQPCENRLPCGHQCTWLCHINDDPDHLKYYCLKECDKLNKGCTQNHKCQRPCNEECELCIEKVKMKRSCGHDFTMPCSKDPEQLVCHNKCKKILDCGHWCKRKCFEECKPCQENIDKVIPVCGHKIKTKCGMNEAELVCTLKCDRQLNCGHQCKEKCVDNCTTKCTVKVGNILSLCGHDVPLLCWENSEGLNTTSDLSRCHKPCNCELDCGHKCAGNCFSCQQGRFHLPCKQACNRKLVCGHSCAGECSVPCPPCNKNCTNLCNHTRCDNMCGLPCKQCKQSCNWRCEHNKCTSKCSQPCNRPPCNEPCTKQLKCEHMCAGLCGELCPPMCWECDKEELLSEAMDQESEPPQEPRFLLLPECKHIIEVNALERWLAWQHNHILKPSCPRCKTPITKLKRYQENFKSLYFDLSSIRYRLFKQIGPEFTTKLLETTYQLQITDSLSKDSFDHIHKALTQIHAFLQPSRSFKRHQDKHMYNMFRSLQTKSFDLKISLIENMCLILKTYKTSKEGQKILNPMTEFILNCFEKRGMQFGIGDATQIAREMLRLKHMAQALHLLESTSSQNKATVQDLCDHIIKLQCYTEEQQAKTEEKLKEIPRTSKITYGQECVAVKIKIPMQQVQGFWFKCPENHLTFKNDILEPTPKKCDICDYEPIGDEKCPTFKKDNNIVIMEEDVEIPAENINFQQQHQAMNNIGNYNNKSNNNVTKKKRNRNNRKNKK